MGDHYDEVALDGAGPTAHPELLAPTRLNGSTHVRHFRWTGPTHGCFRTLLVTAAGRRAARP